MNAVNPGKEPQIKLRDGARIPVLGMGTFGSDKYGAETVADAVLSGIKAGYRLFDCASVYGNEKEIGRRFARAMEENIVTRDELFIMSKVWNDSHEDVLGSLKKTLSDLRLDHLDAYFVHWPLPNYHAPGVAGDSRDPNSVPFSAERFMATWRQMEQAQRAGLTKSIGMSNMTVKKLSEILPLCEIPPALIEMEMHPSFQQTELFKYCISRGIQPVAYCPMGSPSRPERDRTPEDVADFDLPEVAEIAKAHGVHPALICLKWAVQRGAVAIPFSVTEEKYTANLRAVKEDMLTDAEMRRMEKAERGCRLIKGQVFLWGGETDWRKIWDEV